MMLLLALTGCAWVGGGDVAEREALFQEVTIGIGVSCRLDGGGHVECAGDTEGGVEPGGSLPVPTFEAPDAEARFLHLSRHGGTSCALDEDWQVQCFGRSRFDEHESIHDTQGLYFEQVSDFTATRASSHACGLTEDGEVVCWGPAAASPDGLYRFQQVSVGPGAACGITVADSVECWSRDVDSLVVQEAEAWANAGDAAQVGVGKDFACVLTTDDALWCFGDVPDPYFGLEGEPTVQLSVGYRSACGIHTDGDLWCFDDDQAAPVPGAYAAVSAGVQSLCAVSEDGRQTTCMPGDDPWH